MKINSDKFQKIPKSWKNHNFQKNNSKLIQIFFVGSEIE